ncbi:MAG: hypothetical protein HY646_06060 [Acidobacteria bacterium]|nr:hypothetical protein [Acidobacteriota bacterium]
MSHTIARAIQQVAELLDLDADSVSIPVVPHTSRQQDEHRNRPLARFSRHGICASGDDFSHVIPQLKRIAQHAPSARALIQVAHACGLTQDFWKGDRNDGHGEPDDATIARKLIQQWRYLFGQRELATRDTTGEDALGALIALHELGAKPEVIFLDDLPYLAPQAKPPFGERKMENARKSWWWHMERYRRLFTVHCPPLPVQTRHEREPDRLFPFLAWELSRLIHPAAAVIDLLWYSANEGKALHSFGLQLIRMVRAIRPTMPIFVWSNITEGPMLQRALQLGANYYFNKEPDLASHHGDDDDPREDANYLNPGKLWFHIWEWEEARYSPPLRDAGDEPFLSARTPEQEKNRKRVMAMLGLKEHDLNRESRHDAVRLLRALLPEAQTVEIPHVLGGGVSGSLAPFIAQGRTMRQADAAERGFLKPVQVKLSRDWRALARERKGYHDIIRPMLGPAAAQVLAGPYRIGEWSGMVQSYAAPEEAYRAPSTRGTRSLFDVLTDHLHDVLACERIANSVFEAVLSPFYAGRTYRADFPCHRAFMEVTPPHLTGYFVPWDRVSKLHDFSIEKLSRKNERARREAAGRKWRSLMSVNNRHERGADHTPLFLSGLQIDTLECDRDDPSRSRLRLIEPTLGVKVDLFPNPGQPDTSRWWSYLDRSPIGLRGQLVTVGVQARRRGNLGLGDGWRDMLEGKARDHGLRGARFLCTVGEDKRTLPGVDYILNFHSIDHTESFLLGPVHGDLNLRNILLYEKDGAFFPWLIDFDRTQTGLPIIFDLVKLEVEAFHQVGAALFHELAQQCELPWYEQPMPEYTLPHFVADFEEALEAASPHARAAQGPGDLDHLWVTFDECNPEGVPSLSLRHRFTGFFGYLKTVRDNVWRLGIEPREYQLARLYYCLCCLKFDNLYDRRQSPHAPFAAQLLLYKLQCTARFLDRENGIDSETRTCHADHKIIASLIERIRRERGRARESRSLRPFADLIDEWRMPDSFAGLSAAKLGVHVPDPSEQQKERIAKFERILRILRNSAVPGKNSWFREVLWYLRDAGDKGIGTPEQLAAFTVAMVLASQEPDDDLPRLRPKRRDFASTGRIANTWPTQKMFEHLATHPPEFVKVSSRGESGGTIEMLEQAGLNICHSLAAVEDELERSGWAVAEAGSHLCEVDQILMDLRKKSGCMKVGDLVISSISAKKISVEIGRFDVEIATGYDAKFADLLEGHENLSKVQERWKQTWSEVCAVLGAAHEEYRVGFESFDSNQLDPKRANRGDHTLFIIGSEALASLLFNELELEIKNALNQSFPAEFREKASHWNKIIADLKNAEATRWKLDWVTNESTVLSKAKWGILESLPEHGTGMAALLLDLSDASSGTHGIPLNVDRLDGLYGELKRNGDPRTSILVFAKAIPLQVDQLDGLYGELKRDGDPTPPTIFVQRIVILIPAAELRGRDPDMWAWQILRESFKEALPELEVPAAPRGVTVLGPA